MCCTGTHYTNAMLATKEKEKTQLILYNSYTTYITNISPKNLLIDERKKKDCCNEKGS